MSSPPVPPLEIPLGIEVVVSEEAARDQVLFTEEPDFNFGVDGPVRLTRGRYAIVHPATLQHLAGPYRMSVIGRRVTLPTPGRSMLGQRLRLRERHFIVLQIRKPDRPYLVNFGWAELKKPAPIDRGKLEGFLIPLRENAGDLATLSALGDWMEDQGVSLPDAILLWAEGAIPQDALGMRAHMQKPVWGARAGDLLVRTAYMDKDRIKQVISWQIEGPSRREAERLASLVMCGGAVPDRFREAVFDAQARTSAEILAQWPECWTEAPTQIEIASDAEAQVPSEP